MPDYFFKNNIRYEYEKLLILGKRNARVRPDFYLPDYDLVVEYWGLMDLEDEDKRIAYLDSMKLKIQTYREEGVKFISLYPLDLQRLDSVFRAKLMEVTGLELQ